MHTFKFVRQVLIAAALTSSFASTVHAADKSSSAATVNESDARLMTQLAQANIAEIDSAKAARTKSKSDSVQNFAKTMTDDHSKALEELSALAKKKNVKLPANADIKHQAALAKLQLLDGEQFDKEYISQAGVNDHKEAKALVGKISSTAKDSEFKALADKLAPTIEHHLQMAEKLKSS